MAKQTQPEEPRPLHELLPPAVVSPMGAPDPQQNQGNLLAAKQSPIFPVACGVLAHCLSRRGERIMLDYTAQGVAVRFEIDSVWMNAEPMDRQTGDAVLAVYKKIANLNVQDRRSRQDGKFGLEFTGGKYICEFTSQGVPTGERVMIKVKTKKPKYDAIEQLGMREKMRQRLKQLLDSPPGFIIVSAPAGGGLTTLWNITLGLADRLVRDFVSMEDKGAKEDDIINVNPWYFNKSAGETPMTIMNSLLLKQPDAFVMPELTNAETVEALCEQVNNMERMVVARVVAKDVFEALQRVLAYKGPVPEFAKALTGILNMRLIRKLCDQCKQPFQPPPQLLQRLGIPPGRMQLLYQEYKPPPEPPVDEKGRPIEIPPCAKCGGLGYHGRTGIFELLIVDEPFRQALTKQPNTDALRGVAKTSGHRSLQEEGILLVAQGVTSVQELQRVLSAKP